MLCDNTLDALQRWIFTVLRLKPCLCVAESCSPDEAQRNPGKFLHRLPGFCFALSGLHVDVAWGDSLLNETPFSVTPTDGSAYQEQCRSRGHAVCKTSSDKILRCSPLINSQTEMQGRVTAQSGMSAMPRKSEPVRHRFTIEYRFIDGIGYISTCIFIQVKV